MKVLQPLLVIAALACAQPVFAGYDTLVDEGCSDESDCTYLRPKLQELKGWHIDEAESALNLGNVLVPDGSTAKTAKVSITVRARAKDRLEARANNVAEYMKVDAETMEQMWPGTIAADAPALKSGDGKMLPARTYAPVAGNQNWFDLKAYDQDGDQFLEFTLSGKTKADLDSGVNDFKRLVASFKVKP